MMERITLDRGGDRAASTPMRRLMRVASVRRIVGGAILAGPVAVGAVAPPLTLAGAALPVLALPAQAVPGGVHARATPASLEADGACGATFAPAVRVGVGRAPTFDPCSSTPTQPAVQVPAPT